MTFPFTPELKVFEATDKAWSRELTRLFGKNAGDYRYRPIGKGDPGSKLRTLHDNREAARLAWEAGR